MEWDSAFIEKTYQDRIRERELAPMMARREDNLFKLTSKSLYGEKVHYALELIQNAEDAGASTITFIFDKERLVVVNDGDVFLPDDVDAICSVEPGRKKNKIGFFGIGFKSVFNITNAPQVVSSSFNFKIENFIYPRPVDILPEDLAPYYNKDKGAIFIFPQTEGLPSIPELIENFKEIDEKILLFLNKLKALHFIDKVNGEEWRIEKPATEDSIIILKNGKTGKETKWKVFPKDLPVCKEKVPIPEGKEGITDTRILIAFPCDEATKEANKGSTVYCYLPTKKRSDMLFLVQADFVPTVGRADIQDVDWNKWLLKKLGRLAADAIDQIKEDPSLSKGFYDFIPLKDEVHEPLMSILSDSMHESLRSKRIAKTSLQEWKTPAECVSPVSAEITEIISQPDLSNLFGKPLSYVGDELSERSERVLTSLGASVLDDALFVEFLSKEDLIKKRKPEWFLRAYAYLSEVFDVSKTNWDDSFDWEKETLDLFSKLEKNKFILTTQNKLVPLKDPENPDRLICYPRPMDLSEVNELLTEGELVFLNRHFQLSTIIKRTDPDPEEEKRREKSHTFFKGIGVKAEFRQSHIIRDAILPKYSSGKYKEYDDAKLYNLVNYIRAYWPTLESEVKNKRLGAEIFDEIRKTVLLKAYALKNGEPVPDYLPPGMLYFSKRYGPSEIMEDLFEGVEGIHFLAPYYLNREKREQKKARRGRQRAEMGWKKFAETLGVWSSPRVEKNDEYVSITGKSGYDWVKRGHSPRGIHSIGGDSFSEDIQSLIKHCAEKGDSETSKQKMTLLFRSLSDNWKEYKDFCSTTYRYFYGRNYDVPYENSSFLNFLRKSKWLPTSRGFSKPEDAFLDSQKNRFLLGDTVTYSSLTGNQAFMKDIGLNLEPTTGQVIDHLKEYKAGTADAKKGEGEKFRQVYSFLAEKLKAQAAEHPGEVESLKKEFEKSELVYLPRKDRSWWKPSMVFWRDYSKTFGLLRGYVEHEGKEIYPQDTKPFFSALEVTETPTVKQALEVLDEFKQKNDAAAIKKIVTKVYTYVNDLLTHSSAIEDDVDWKSHHFLTSNETFSTPDNVYYNDDEEYSKEFQGKAEFLHIPYSSWTSLQHFLKAAGFKSFSKHLSIRKNLDPISEVEAGQVAILIRVLAFAKTYLLNKNLEAYERLQAEGVFDRAASLEVYQTTKISLDLFLKKDETESVAVEDYEKLAYYSSDENRLYILKGVSLLSGDVAKEVSRIFKGAENEAFPFLSSVLAQAGDEATLEKQLRLFGIKEEETPYQETGKVELITEKPAPDTEAEKREQEKPGEEKQEEAKVEPPKPPEPPKGLIDPDDYYPSTAKVYTPFKRTEGEAPRIVKEIKLKEGEPGTTKLPRESTVRLRTADAEGTAIQLVLNYENGEGRPAEDRHRQKRIGYDVYSKTPEGEERFIEVKGFKDKEGTITLTSYEREKAQKEQDKYYIYVVTGVKEGSKPKLYIIQNPLKWLTPDPPAEENYSDWKNAIQTEYEFKKA